MLTRKTQYAWMAMGGLICLFGLVLACKLRDGNKAIAQDDKKAPTPPPLVEPPLPPPVLSKDPTPIPKSDSIVPDAVLPPKRDEGKKDAPAPASKSEPKATIEMPFAPPSGALPGLSGPPAPPTMPPASGSILPASFGPNTPAPKTEKAEDNKKAKEPSTGDAKAAPTWDKPTNAVPFTPSAPPPMPEAKPEGKPMDKKPAAPSAPASPPPSKPLPPALPMPGSNEIKVTPTSFAPVSAAPPSTGPDTADHDTKTQPGEPPLAPAPGPVQTYHVHGSETLQDIARRTLGSSDRVSELHKLNPMLKLDAPLSAGTTVRLPGDACVQADDAEPVKPLPALRAKPTPPKAKVLPLTGTYQCSLDEKGQLTLPRALRDQFGGSDTVLLSPGPDKCLWLTNQPHLERLAERLEQSQANEADVRVFKRLYYAQTEKVPVSSEGRVGVPERLAQFAGLHQEVVLVGIDDHFEVWDSARWRQYTQQKSAGRSTPGTED